ncbi:N-lysine methyltransferase setd6 isoform X2 [Cololabis saira]|uniref:N-lysine methyltransferase setd6 isoform X2 n=1 Tax=Cololabis saira TaxID=129043 RepID=UPI002AD44CC6|nr:N-lysine methyltransferase setd6 isoform X2 [Cololabis saira]
MATAAKRPKVEGSERLQNFLQWCRTAGLVLSTKVCVSTEGTVADYGMVATDDIHDGEVLFTIPRSALLHQGTTKVSALLEAGKQDLQSSSGWVPLLLALLHEYTTPQSRWTPYLSLWPDFSALDQPMFWSRAERDGLLRGTGVPRAVETDLSNIQREYQHVALPFMRRHPDVWSPGTHTLQLYTRLVAFVMAYSFTEPRGEDGDEEEDDEEEDEEEAPGPPMMVPMADMLNHVSRHNAQLEFTADSLKMVSMRYIRRGEEVFNTYGQLANAQLLHMYGFTEPYPSNANDTADVPVSNLLAAARRGDGAEGAEKSVNAQKAVGSGAELERVELEQLVEARVELEQLVEARVELLSETMQEKGAFVFSEQGCLTDSELHAALKVLCMTKEELVEFRDNEGWEEDDEDDETSHAFSNEGLPGLKASWKRLIHEATRLTLGSYRDGGAEDGAADGDTDGDTDGDRLLMEDEAALQRLSSRQGKALQVRYGQKRILYRLLELTQS